MSSTSMSSTSKRLDLRFGAFACSVQGFDDPVQPVQQILRAIQHLLEESPELSDTAINFDAEAIEQLVGEVARRSELDESDLEIVPGLVIIHHGAGGDLAAADPSPGDEAWRDEAREAEDRDSAGYVNIFAPAGGGAPGDTGDGDEPPGAEDVATTGAGDEESEEDFADRLRRMATAAEEDYGWAEEGYDVDEEAGEESGEESGVASPAGGESEEDVSEEESEDDEPPLNLFAPAAGAGPAAADKSEGASVRNLFAVSRDEPEDSWQSAEGAAEEEPSAGADQDLGAADLAERAGATTVPELMVASAAWMVLTLGQTSFTRRDVLDVFETIPGDHENTPEARVKGFGKAVRNGQLVATGEGIFGLSRSELQRFQELL